MTERYIGIMSGTSMDGADAVLIEMNGTQWHQAIAHSSLAYPPALKQQLLELQNIGTNEIHRAHLLAQQLSDIYAQVVHQLLSQQNLAAHQIRAIGCHGQTIRHAPEHHYSVQIGDLARLAEQTHIFTIGDFRSRDLAAGGQGAPLVPAFHHALFSHPTQNRVLLNIGGIANISILQPNRTPYGYDTGVGNMLLDAWTHHIWQQPYDDHGKIAQTGNVLPDLLHRLIAHPYFTQQPPKSTGRELFSLDWLQQHLTGNESPKDVLRTLVELTAQSIAQAITQSAPNTQTIYLCGGGIHNTTLTQRLQQLLQPAQLLSTDTLHLPPQWMEAAAFAWLAACWVNRTPSNPPHATGARHPCILGCGYYA